MKVYSQFKLKKMFASLVLVGGVTLFGCQYAQADLFGGMFSGKSADSGSGDNGASSSKKKESGSEDLLAYLDKGEQLRAQNNYTGSREAWLQADDLVHQWEEAVKIDPGKFLGNVGSFVLNDSTRRYDGRDYEKVFLSVRLALDHLALGDMESARTEIKKMHEREAIIAEFRAKDVESAKEDAQKKGLKATSTKQLAGYPVETLDDPEVRGLTNSYESAFANYLAGFVYEALDEPSLASAGYRKAIELHPGNDTLENGLKDLDDRISLKRRQNKESGVDTLFVVETGFAPKIESKTLPLILPIPGSGGISMVATPISWPVINPVNTSIVPHTISLDDKPLPLVMITNVDLMARRALSDEMPGIIVRSSIRAVVKGAAQREVQKQASSFGMFGALVSMAAGAVAIATETADTRNWGSLPGFYSVGRMTLTPGAHTVAIDTPRGRETRDIKVSGKQAVVVLHSSTSGLSLAQTPNSEAVAMLSNEIKNDSPPVEAAK